MDSDKILNADLLDLLFEGKNKEYGAYDLRRTYNKRVTISISAALLICLLFFLTQLFASDKDKRGKLTPVTEINLKNLDEPDEKRPEPKPVPPPKVPQQKVEVTGFTPPKIVDDPEVKDPPPAIDELQDTRIGLIDQAGVKDETFIAPPPETQGTGYVEQPKKQEQDIDKVFTKVEKEAQFPGGLEGWKRYLERALNANVAADDGAATGNYTVKVQFIVDKEGNVSNVQAIEVPGTCPACGLEAVKVIRKGPRWEPAIQNGNKVIYQAVQYVTFQVAEE